MANGNLRCQAYNRKRGFIPSHLSAYSFIVNEQLLATYRYLAALAHPEPPLLRLG